MQNRIPFLSAKWNNLILFNFAVPDEVLTPYLPPQCELDRYEGSAFMSLVAFQFLDTRVLGIPWPGFVNFPEINLRFYIRHRQKRGVCFIREFVPSRFVSGVARILYNEPYFAAKMSMRIHQEQDDISAHYTLENHESRLRASVLGTNQTFLPEENSLEHFFKEHDLGVGKNRRGKLLTYEVSHPFWNVYPIKKYELELDWRKLYGESFAFLENLKPNSVCFVEGSSVKVFWKSQ